MTETLPLPDDALIPSPDPEIDLNEPPEPLIVRVGDQLIVFRDEYGSQGPRCVALTSRRKRCAMTVQTPGSGYHLSEWAVAGVGELEALESNLPDECYIQQRCERHIDSGQPDAVPPTWELFDPARHADLIHRIARPTWTPDGLKHLHDDGVEFVSQASAIDAAYESFYERLQEARRLRPSPARQTALYRFFDADDRLLYVGITDHLEIRHMQHVERSSWMEFAARSTIERHPTRDDALTAEVRAIETEAPLFNREHNDLAAPRRLVEYLIEHGRTDLLAPAVSRG